MAGPWSGCAAKSAVAVSWSEHVSRGLAKWWWALGAKEGKAVGSASLSLLVPVPSLTSQGTPLRAPANERHTALISKFGQQNRLGGWPTNNWASLNIANSSQPLIGRPITEI
jgi:hypothetical protein